MEEKNTPPVDFGVESVGRTTTYFVFLCSTASCCCEKSQDIYHLRGSVHPLHVVSPASYFYLFTAVLINDIIGTDGNNSPLYLAVQIFYMQILVPNVITNGRIL